MSDIVERLRSEAANWSATCGDLFGEAADEIERSRKEADIAWAAEIERLRGENERLRGHIYASNRPQPEDFERLRKLLDACRGAMRVTQRVHPNATDWRGMIAAIDSAIGSKET